MLIDYRNKEVRKICEDEQFARKEYPEKIVSYLGILIHKIAAVKTFDEFKNNPVNRKYKIHNLKGQLKDLISLSLDHSYRMTVKVKVEQNKIIIWEISNHYGD